ncbi:Pvc16 family protein [Robbsia andropogonis]|uniref:Pvc16 family protein n=1 Tax=Robbsia andropogonis TaxID=28092 RepID=UPI000465D781|nr:Pvc16 family protein [Robbsia andropogonis]
MIKEKVDPLGGASENLLSSVSYRLADRVIRRMKDQLKSDLYEGRGDRLAGATNTEIKYTFEIPSSKAQGKNTLISLFLYDVHEDSALRHSAMPIGRTRYPLSAGKRPIRLCYLITCWFPVSIENAQIQSDEAYAMRISDALLTALIGLRGDPLIPDAYCRILPPSEKLFSLGQFWQALEDSHPRLTFGLTITVPYAPAQQPATPCEVGQIVLKGMTENGLTPQVTAEAEYTARLILNVLEFSKNSGSHDIQSDKRNLPFKTATTLKDAERQLLDVLSQEAKQWRDPSEAHSLLGLRSISLKDAIDYDAFIRHLENRANTVRWRNSDVEGVLPWDVAVKRALTRVGLRAADIPEVITPILSNLATHAWTAWCQGRADRMPADVDGAIGEPTLAAGSTVRNDIVSTSDNVYLSALDVMALAGLFGCVALAQSLGVPLGEASRLNQEGGH